MQHVDYPAATAIEGVSRQTCGFPVVNCLTETVLRIANSGIWVRIEELFHCRCPFTACCTTNDCFINTALYHIVSLRSKHVRGVSTEVFCRRSQPTKSRPLQLWVLSCGTNIIGYSACFKTKLSNDLCWFKQLLIITFMFKNRGLLSRAVPIWGLEDPMSKVWLLLSNYCRMLLLKSPLT